MPPTELTVEIGSYVARSPTPAAPLSAVEAAESFADLNRIGALGSYNTFPRATRLVDTGTRQHVVRGRSRNASTTCNCRLVCLLGTYDCEPIIQFAWDSTLLRAAAIARARRRPQRWGSAWSV